MIKLCYCLRRLSNLSLEEFQTYWFDTHGPLVRKYQDALRIQRYVQVHTRTHEVNDAFRESRDAREPYDGVAELWWNSVEDLTEAMATPEGQEAAAALLNDEKKFIDLSKSALWVAEERPVIEAHS